jgi:hypothetical protein
MIDASDFQSLVEAYGADARRWPADRRAGAEAFVAAEPARASAILALEAELDERLDVLRPPSASEALRERILAGAPQPRADGWRGMFGWLRPGVGIAMAASCAAGVVAGLLLIQPAERGDMGGDAAMAALSGPGDASDEDGEVS